MNSNTESEVTAVTLNTTTAVTLVPINDRRIMFEVNNNNASHAFWLRFYPAAQDNLKQGIYISSKAWNRTFYTMPVDNIYTGEISAISETDSPIAYITEY